MKFMLSIPTFIQFGKSVSKKAGEVALGFGAKTVFCVYDKGVAKIATGVVETLKESGLEVIEFDSVLPNPTDSLIENAAQLARNAKADVVVAIGGGSSIDAAKGIAILLTNPSPITLYAGPPNLVKIPAKPLIAIPTTSGTGSEVTPFSVITVPSISKKVAVAGQFVAPAVALCDPLMTVGMPPSITASTGMDALTHAIESYTANNASIPTDDFALRSISLISKNIVKATNNGANIEARANMQLGSLLGGIVFANAFVGMVHSLAHPISAHCNVAHGIANAACLSYVMEYNAVEVPDRTIEIGVAMGLDLQEIPKEEAIKKVVSAVQDLVDAVKIPKLSAVGVTEDKFNVIAEDAVVEIPSQFNARTVTKEACLDVLRRAF
ncbi:1,3-propanediol dehydrogenase [Sporomusa silvacetica DSM 10669]|uniref:1,3-propanediol dehydrogenase n=1 Tax=Sporomusa silvacetica DSM 10669 TaxID=1123289 RepID=A0ABZ3IGS1_9FIRM|nr:iron-containing alcohol dehydrogenase [Sporomusa silvacetica]OZC13075.1 1,3-propanediol dehydrogenase [Sporomusa silvacetica DSM 10669]